jgi:serine/threonine protein kinase
VNVDRYALREKLGQGTTGAVFLAFDPKLNRDVAVKVFTAAGDDDAVRQRFEREGRALVSLHHPNIVQIFDFGAAAGKLLYLVTEYVCGADLGKLVVANGAFPEPMLVAVGLELCAALSHIHGLGIIHRALKPENLLLHQGRLVLTDFGIVKGFGESGSLGASAARPHTVVVGVPGFTSPEQLEQKQLDGRADLFAFGALLYYLASGSLPYPTSSRYALIEQFRKVRPQPLAELCPALSQELTVLIHGCLEIQPSRRPESATVVRQWLQHILERHGQRDAREILTAYEKDPTLAELSWVKGGQPELDQPQLVPAIQRRPRRRWLVLIGLGVLAALLGVAGAAYLRSVTSEAAADSPRE